ncbi:hypothetical protein G6F57_021825 [Rhizopus arrhizus]|nr:hypothetical protein G6F57_021825 [Rhizopus arrhizus]
MAWYPPAFISLSCSVRRAIQTKPGSHIGTPTALSARAPVRGLLPGSTTKSILSAGKCMGRCIQLHAAPTAAAAAITISRNDHKT